MQKKIVKAGPMGSGHLMLEFEDGTKQMVHRGDHERHDPKPGDTCPSDGHEHVIKGVQTGALRKKAYVANKIESIEIIPGENGGHRGVQNFKREAGKKEGPMAGGVHMERPKPAEHFFGKSEDGKALPNVGKVLPPLGAGKVQQLRPRRYHIERATEQRGKVCHT
jgi:hypothetical protein